MHLRGKRTLMTGVTGGLGPSLVEAFLALGADVLATGRRRTALDDLRAEMRHHDRLAIAECDLCDAEGVEALFDAWTRKGTPDVVVHAAGAFDEAKLEEQSDEAIERVIDDNLRSAALVLRAALRRMSSGSVVVVASAPSAEPEPELALYCAAKAAVVHLVSALAEQSGELRINAILPGVLDTPGNREREGSRVDPRAVARAAVWLAAEESERVSGAHVRVA
jgi:NAD(P)-dependent dehydrogenase (short-subunit alcohol dehydrogenase family)